MKENKDGYTENEKKNIHKVSSMVAKLKCDDQEKMKWIMIGMQIANDNTGAS